MCKNIDYMIIASIQSITISFTGPPGNKGPDTVGPKGPIGPKGDAVFGEIGVKGIKGEQGPQGPTGLDAPQKGKCCI